MELLLWVTQGSMWSVPMDTCFAGKYHYDVLYTVYVVPHLN